MRPNNLRPVEFIVFEQLGVWAALHRKASP